MAFYAPVKCTGEHWWPSYGWLESSNYVQHDSEWVRQFVRYCERCGAREVVTDRRKVEAAV